MLSFVVRGRWLVLVAMLGALIAAVAWAAASALLPNGVPLGVIVRGLVYGSIDGMIALGLVLVYRSNRIVNFAASALGGVGGVFAVQLFIEKDVPWLLAAFIGLVFGVVIGAAVAAVQPVGQPDEADQPPSIAVLDDQGRVVTPQGQLVAEFGLDYARADRNRRSA